MEKSVFGASEFVLINLKRAGWQNRATAKGDKSPALDLWGFKKRTDVCRHLLPVYRAGLNARRLGGRNTTMSEEILGLRNALAYALSSQAMAEFPQTVHKAIINYYQARIAELTFAETALRVAPGSGVFRSKM